MEVILLKDMGNLGDKHDVVTVKPGYGRNYLIPKGLALIANGTNMQKLDDIIAKEKAAEEARVDEFKSMITTLDGQTVKIGVKAGASGKIFGSVNALTISQAIQEQYSLEIPRKKIDVADEMKEVGTYDVALNLHPDAKGKVSVELVQE